MKARIVTGEAPGGVRQKLADVLPLRTPFLIEIFPIYACNFRCRYCVMSLDKRKHGFISDAIMLDYDLYRKCINDLNQFPDRVKVARFSGIGEPLIHKHMADMIGYARDVVDKTEILTNASLLTNELSDNLIVAGLTRLFVSIQGTTKEKYKEICGASIDIDKLVNNLRYYYEHKGSGQQIHIKIIDYALDGNEDEQKFYDIFGDVCDTIGIEYIGAIHPVVDYSNILKDKPKRLTQYGIRVLRNVKICPQAFFRLQINPDGKVVPCYSLRYPTIMGDCNKESLKEIWEGENFRKFRLKMLDGIDNVNEVCAKCEIIRHRVFPEDILDSDVERLGKIYEAD